MEITDIRRYKQRDTEQLQTMSTAPLSVRRIRNKATNSIPIKIVG
jgi:hypothetical protein